MGLPLRWKIEKDVLLPTLKGESVSHSSVFRRVWAPVCAAQAGESREDVYSNDESYQSLPTLCGVFFYCFI